MVSTAHVPRHIPSKVSEQAEQQVHALFSLDHYLLEYQISGVVTQGQPSLVRSSRHTHDVEEEERVPLPELAWTCLRGDVDEGAKGLCLVSIELISESQPKRKAGMLTTISSLNLFSDSCAAVDDGSLGPRIFHSGDGAAVVQAVELVPLSIVAGGVGMAGEKVSSRFPASCSLSASSLSPSSSCPSICLCRSLLRIGRPRPARNRETKSSSLSSSRSVREALEALLRGVGRRTRVDGVHSFFSRRHLAHSGQSPLHWTSLWQTGSIVMPRDAPATGKTLV